MILSAIFILLIIIILLFLYLLTEETCLWELIKLFQVFTRQYILSISYKTVKSYETPLSVKR